ncbi:MAG: PEP-CTERM sorting domain-containing protein [Planctomycetaceae bacterium]
MYDQSATGISAQPILKFLGPQRTIPEPGTLGLGVLGGALGGLLRWNRRRSAI